MTVPQDAAYEAVRQLMERPQSGVESGQTKQELYERARQLDIPRRSAMTKGELARAIARREA
ncbi:MAG: hypothetical protein QOH46_3678 [Solirubrobacteraceae bacterium]|jgi:hypothetical protein|nr:hypothetical protein [Solirubrobacteraceae bacterium]